MFIVTFFEKYSLAFADKHMNRSTVHCTKRKWRMEK